jgi:hypothetical protein
MPSKNDFFHYVGERLRSPEVMHQAKRCGARTRSGKPCQSPAMANGRCRMHGGPSSGAPKGNRNAFKHGRYTAEAIARRREISALIRVARRLGIADNL